MGTYVSLINLDTGEILSLGKLKVNDAPYEFSDLFKNEDTNVVESMLGINGIWHSGISEKIKSNPKQIEDLLFALSTFLIASRGQRLTLAVNPDDEIMLDDLYTSLKISHERESIPDISDVVTSHNMAHFKGFISRRLEWIKFLPKKAMNAYMHKDLYQAYLALGKRKTKLKSESLNSYDESDYTEIMEWGKEETYHPDTDSYTYVMKLLNKKELS